MLETNNIKIKKVMLTAVAMGLSIFVWNDGVVFADEYEYLDLDYKIIKCSQNTSEIIACDKSSNFESSDKYTTIWYAKIPKQYKMHYAYAQDAVLGNGVSLAERGNPIGEEPSVVAERHGATLAINSQFLGFPVVDGETLNIGESVSGYDFSVSKNDAPTSRFDFLDVSAVPTDGKSETDGISFAGVNLDWNYYGNSVRFDGSDEIDGKYFVRYGTTIYMSLYTQLVKDGTEITDSDLKGTLLISDFDKSVPALVSGDNYTERFNETISSCSRIGFEFVSSSLNEMKTGNNDDTMKTFACQRYKELTGRDPRTWLAYDWEGNQYVAVATGRVIYDGVRQSGLNYNEMIDVTKYIMNEENAFTPTGKDSIIQTMYNLDGGGSSNFWYKGSKLNPNIDSNGTVERKTYGIFFWAAETKKDSDTKPSDSDKMHDNPSVPATGQMGHKNEELEVSLTIFAFASGIMLFVVTAKMIAYVVKKRKALKF